MWIARDRNGRLYLYSTKPIRNILYDCFGIGDNTKNIFITQDYDYAHDLMDFNHDACIELDESMYPEVTWENSPIQLVLNLEKITE